ncbi:tRNA (adenosine(37)-N6)-threonylcarbamoyltransferase complex dimerization subunit type 1 TsaB [Ruminiclostridium cellulolyticum]|uniref:Peptidase M22 glycoprotease n=1 Tax=Ruminiclostridium cellulolyticum (strain ATCC 35319 / DSM 5812 / JCM 6584 / H10) TaxID=394503 RepID=B8I821_RUMCH|nr:tRNA (adenosine(37)-N6)-threonylcarbamoyltransferase complex dimerization subunit type 1 TsaB [Ruminiclostridium cellulolyticum]ACL75178.1 peptidase M22 glycoprotease [Ruminiclostridium cellulolyticum H10]
MRILAVDTSTNVASAAILEDEVIIGEYNCNRGKTHSQRLMPMVQHLMETAGLTVSDIDAFSASIGPGSFTGLRIGVTTIKAMAFAAEKPVISVHTLDALAYNIPFAENLVCPMIDARNNQVFTAIYRFIGGKLERLTEYLGIPVTELADTLRVMDGKITFLGDACSMHKEYFEHELGDRVRIASANTALAKASSVAILAGKAYREGKLESYYDMVPFYLRKSQAERERENRKVKDD